jgi:hypothetical protein
MLGKTPGVYTLVRPETNRVVLVPVINIYQSWPGLIMAIIIGAFNYIQSCSIGFNNGPGSAYFAKFAKYGFRYG